MTLKCFLCLWKNWKTSSYRGHIVHHLRTNTVTSINEKGSHMLIALTLVQFTVHKQRLTMVALVEVVEK